MVSIVYYDAVTGHEHPDHAVTRAQARAAAVKIDHWIATCSPRGA